MEKKLAMVLFAALLCFAGSSLYDAYNDETESISLTHSEKLEDSKTKSDNSKDVENKIVVYIEGAVAKPGLVYLNKDARIGEVVEMAGGLLANADTDNLNLADKVTDGQKISIPVKPEDDISRENISDKSDLININTANEQELQKLPRVGPATAKNIIEYREKHGKFKTIEEIKNVPRIGEKTFEKFKDKIKV